MADLIRPDDELLLRLLYSEPLLSGLGIETRIRPSIRLIAHRSKQPLDRGASRIGGTPDLPHGFEWPLWEHPRLKRRGLGRILSAFDRLDTPSGMLPLSFIAQIDLSAMPHIDEAVPATGWLCFFYDLRRLTAGYNPAHRGCCKVAYFNCSRSALEPRNPPSPTREGKLCRIEAVPEWTIPDLGNEIDLESPAGEALRAIP